MIVCRRAVAVPPGWRTGTWPQPRNHRTRHRSRHEMDHPRPPQDRPGKPGKRHLSLVVTGRAQGVLFRPEMSGIGLMVPGMNEPPIRYDITVTVDREGGCLPDPAEFAVAAGQAASN